MEQNELSSLALDLIQTTIVLLGGLVALYEYRRFRRYSAKAQLELDFDLHQFEGASNHTFLLDIRPRVRNMGRVRQRFPIFQVWAKGLLEPDITRAETRSTRELEFKRKLMRNSNIVKNPKDPYFVDPGVEQVFPYRAVVTDPGEYLLVVARFYYEVSLPRYLWLRLVVALGRSERWQDQKKVERLKKFRVDEFHVISKIKPTRSPILSLERERDRGRADRDAPPPTPAQLQP